MQEKQGVKFWKTPDAILRAQLEAWDKIIVAKGAENPSFKAVNESMKTFAQRADELADWRYAPIEAICRAGVRSTTAAAILTCLGFEQVANLKHGMLAWNDCGLPVKR